MSLGERDCPSGCGRTVRQGHLLCAACWHQVPREIQQEVYRTWKKWRVDFGDPDKAEAYRSARDAALASLP
jgi:hypothetical protein